MEHIGKEALAKYIETGEIDPAGEAHLSICDHCLDLVSIALSESQDRVPLIILNRAKASFPSRHSYILPITASIAASLILVFLGFLLLVPKGQGSSTDKPDDLAKRPIDRMTTPKEPGIKPDLSVLSKAYDELITSYKTSRRDPNNMAGPMGFAPYSNKTPATTKLAQIESKLGFKTVIPKEMPNGFTLQDATEKDGRVALLYSKDAGVFILIFEERTKAKDMKQTADSSQKAVYLVKDGILVVLMSKSLEMQESAKIAEQLSR